MLAHPPPIIVVGGSLRAWMAALLACAACAGPLAQRAGGAHQLYRDADFGREHLREGGVGFLAPSLSLGQETLGHALLPGLFDAFQEDLPDSNIVPPDLAASRINEAGLGGPYARMMRNYDRTGILERGTLAPIAAALEARYLAVPILVNLREETYTRFSVFGVRVGKTTVTNIRVQLEIWDGEKGRIVWEGLSDVTLAEEVVRERSIYFERALETTWDLVLKKIPNSGVAAPPPDR